MIRKHILLAAGAVIFTMICFSLVVAGCSKPNPSAEEIQRDCPTLEKALEANIHPTARPVFPDCFYMPEYMGDSLRVSLFTVTADEMVAFEGVLDSSGYVPFHRFHLVETDSTGAKVTTDEYRDYSTLTSGVYFVRIVTPDSEVTRRLMLLK